MNEGPHTYRTDVPRKVHRLIYGDGTHYAWAFVCPGCERVHHCDQRWTFNGDQDDKPTLSPSVLQQTAPRCHLFLREGMIQFLDDCEHVLRGQTVPLVARALDEAWEAKR